MNQLRRFFPWIGFALFAVSLVVVHQQLKGIEPQQVLIELSGIGTSALLVGFCFALLSYGTLCLLERVALNYAERSSVFWKTSSMAAFVGNVVSNNIGLSFLSGTPIRYRFYSKLGMSGAELGKVVGFNFVSFWTGLTLVGSLSLLAIDQAPNAYPKLSVPFLSALIGYVLFVVFFHGRTVQLKSVHLRAPSVQHVLLQILLSSLDWILVAGCLYFLMPEALNISMGHFCAAFLAAQLLGILSQVPGGLGVFEGAILLALNRSDLNSSLLASLLAFRLCYYIFPLVAGLIVYLVYELFELRKASKNAGALYQATAWAKAGYFGVVPYFFATTVFLCGIVLLASGASPALTERLAWLERILPLPVLEISHLLGSVIGLLLIVLSRGLARRLDLAWVLTVTLLFAGTLTCFLKGVDYEEAIGLIAQLCFLLPSRKIFFRRSKALAEWADVKPLSLALLLVFAVSLSVIVGHFGHFSYLNSSWADHSVFEFAFSGEANRYMRTTLGLVLVLLILMSWQAMSVARILKTDRSFNMAQALPVIEEFPSSHCWLATTGDKLFFPSASGRSFLMYQWSGKSWIAMGDPVGAPEEASELIWDFHEAAARHGCNAVFYQIQLSRAQLYVDLGLTLTKLGEEAIVALESFSLEGPSRKDLRQALRLAAKNSWKFEIVPPHQIHEILEDIREVSDQWLQKKSEKSFSLGRFSEQYLCRFPCAVVHNAEHKILGFANIWTHKKKQEISIDLMRHVQPAPHGLMDFLFTELLLWGKSEGYQFFNLGMAPLAGIENRRFAPRWNRLAAFLYRHGRRFYNFHGLRAYKQKFSPQWRPLYLAAEGGLGFGRVLIDITLLINRPLRKGNL